MIFLPTIRFNIATLLTSIAISSAWPAMPALASQWVVVSEESKIDFSGTHAGRAFEGSFGVWTADITFDPDDLASSSATVTVDLTSARTGDATYDSTLPKADWFNVASAGETAVFQTTEIRAGEGDNAYIGDGTLTIRGTSVPVQLPFTLEIDGDTAIMTGQTPLARLDWSIGQGSDATGAWVSLEIPVSVSVTATRRQ